MQFPDYFQSKEQDCQPVKVNKPAVANLKSNLRNSIYTLRFA